MTRDEQAGTWFAFQAALVASGHHSRLIEIPSADHFGTTVAKESIEAILALATAK